MRTSIDDDEDWDIWFIDGPTIPALLITRDRSGLFSIQPTGMAEMVMSNAHASLPEVSRRSESSSSTAMSHHLDLVRSGVASIEEELQQRASILAVDNANLRTILEQTNAELQTLRSKMMEFDTMQKKLVRMQSQVLATEKENKTLKQTLKYLQQELVKSGKKMPLSATTTAADAGASGGNSTLPPPASPKPQS